MFPDGSDAVIMIEHCEDLGRLVNLYRQVAPGENVISIGEDMKAGESLVTIGTKLRPQELGALASQGITEVSVYRKPVVGYLTTGNECPDRDKRARNWTGSGYEWNNDWLPCIRMGM